MSFIAGWLQLLLMRTLGTGFNQSLENVSVPTCSQDATVRWAVANVGAHLPDVFECCVSVAVEQTQGFNVHEIATAFWTMAKAGTHMLDV